MPKISLKTPSEIAIMVEGGKILGEAISKAIKSITPGISTLEIDALIEKTILESGGESSFKKVPRYHWTSCVGINDEVVHSIPRKDKLVKEGDLLKIDAGVLWKGFNTDCAWTVLVEDKGNKQNQGKGKLLEAGKMALWEAINTARPGNRIGHISQKIQTTLEKSGFNPVVVLTGHGIGRKLHEEPLIPGVVYGKIKDTPLLELGMALAIEVIYTQGSPDLIMEEDNWTISTKDGKMSGLFEKTIVVAENGPLILTEVRD